MKFVIPRIAALAAAGLVVAGGAAAAVGSPPEAADDGRATAEGHAGIEVPVAEGDRPTKDDHPGGGDEAGVTEPEDGVGPVDNHGAEVSAVAKDDSTSGAEHGPAVSDAARAGHGAPAGAPVETPNAGGTGTAREASGGASEAGAGNAAAQAAAGSGNAGEHGRP